jgi:hypothetical protein
MIRNIWARFMFLNILHVFFLPCDERSTRLTNVAPRTIGAIYAIIAID